MFLIFQVIRNRLNLLRLKILCYFMFIIFEMVSCFSDHDITDNMGKNKSLSTDERARITKRASEGASSTVIAKELKRNPRTIKKAIENINFTRKVRKDRGKSKLSSRVMREIALAARKMPLHSSKSIFDAAGIANCGCQTT